MIEKLKNTKEINEYFAGWQDLPESERLDVIRNLKKSGDLTAVKVKPDKSFKCPVHSFYLSRPCGLTQCHFHLGHTQSKNCGVFAINTSKNSRLSANEAAEVLSLEVSDVNALSNSAILKIRKTLIRDKLDRHKVAKFSYIKGHCINCEVYMQNDMDMGMSSDLMVGKNFGWCSSECRKAKPKWQFELETEFGCHYMDILATGLSVYGKAEMVDQIFSAPSGYTSTIKRQLYDRINSTY